MGMYEALANIAKMGQPNQTPEETQRMVQNLHQAMVMGAAGAVGPDDTAEMEASPDIYKQLENSQEAQSALERFQGTKESLGKEYGGPIPPTQYGRRVGDSPPIEPLKSNFAPMPKQYKPE